MLDVRRYFQSFTEIADTGDTHEENYYGDLNELLEQHAEEDGHNDIQITTPPSPTGGGGPDFRVWSGASGATGYVEAKLSGGPSLDTIGEAE